MTDPKRFLDPSSDAPDGLRRLLSEGHAASSPTNTQLTDWYASLVPRIGPPDGDGGGDAGPGGDGGAPPNIPGVGGGTTGALAKIALAAALGAGAIAGGVALTRRPDAPAPAPLVATVTTPAASATPLVSAENDDPLPAPSSPPRGPRAPRPHLTRTATPEPVPSSPSPDPATTSLAAPAAASPERPRSELEILTEAKRIAPNQPAAALALLDEHARRYPSGALEQEREVLAIEALVRVGKRADARSRAESFAKKFPASAHLRRIEVVIGPL